MVTVKLLWQLSMSVWLTDQVGGVCIEIMAKQQGLQITNSKPGPVQY